MTTVRAHLPHETKGAQTPRILQILQVGKNQVYPLDKVWKPQALRGQRQTCGGITNNSCYIFLFMIIIFIINRSTSYDSQISRQAEGSTGHALDKTSDYLPHLWQWSPGASTEKFLDAPGSRQQALRLRFVSGALLDSLRSAHEIAAAGLIALAVSWLPI
jgi:hypothetical protein